MQTTILKHDEEHIWFDLIWLLLVVIESNQINYSYDDSLYDVISVWSLIDSKWVIASQS